MSWTVRYGLPLFVLIAFFLTFFYTNWFYGVSTVEVPENLQRTPLGFMCNLFVAIGIPEGWCWLPAIIYLFFVPFLALFALFFGFLEMIGIFNDKIRVILSFAAAFSTIPLGWFTKFVSAVFASFGMSSLYVFAVLFLGGLIITVSEKSAEWGLKIKGFEKEVEEGIKKIKKEEEMREEFNQLIKKAEDLKIMIEKIKLTIPPGTTISFADEISELANTLNEAYSLFYEKNKKKEACEKLAENLKKIEDRVRDKYESMAHPV